MRPGRRLAAALVGVALALSGAACGAQERDDPQRATLLLDFTPNAVHAGIFRAAARGYDTRAGVKLRVRAPGASSDSVKLLAAGRADLAILDIHDLALARERGHDLVGVMALVQRPLAAVIARHEVRSPRLLEGRRAGVSGLPSDDAVLRSVVAGAGGNPRRVRTVTIGFNAVASLLSGRVDAATAFWNVEGVAVNRGRARRGFHVFRVDAFGAPPYPELVLTVTRRTLRERPELVRAARTALARGYRDAIEHPGAALNDLQRAAPGQDSTLAKVQLTLLGPVFSLAGGRFGELDEGRLRAWAAWEARFGITREPPDVRRMFVLSGAR